MITIITEKPNRSIEIKGYGVDSYVDKNNKRIYRVYGIVEPAYRGRIVPRKGEDVEDLYVDNTTIVIYRNEDEKLAVACKDFIDRHVAMKAPIFAVEEFKRWLSESGEELEAEAENVEVTQDAH